MKDWVCFILTISWVIFCLWSAISLEKNAVNSGVIFMLCLIWFEIKIK